MTPRARITAATGVAIKSALILVSTATMVVTLLLLCAADVGAALKNLLNILLISLVVTTNMYLIFLRKTKINAATGQRLDTELQRSDLAVQLPAAGVHAGGKRP